MRTLGIAVVILGATAVVFVTAEAIPTSPPVAVEHATAEEHGRAFSQLVFWATVVGALVVATLTNGLGDLMMSRLERDPVYPPRAPNDETAAMIDAEVNEGGPPSPVPCDTSFQSKTWHEGHTFMGEEPPQIETCPVPDRILRLPLGTAVGAAKSTTLMKSEGLELIRLVIPAGNEVPPHKAPGEITVQCIEGCVLFEHDGGAVEMQPGDLLYLCPQEIHALKGILDSSVLVTRLRPRADELPGRFPEGHDVLPVS